MAITLEDIDRRLHALERQVADLRQQLQGPSEDETPAQSGARLLEQARRNKQRLKAIGAKVFAQMGITGEAVSPEKLRQMMADCGIRAEDNLFSRGIVEMREE